MGGYHRKPVARFNDLSPREMDVLRCAAIGLQNKQIARELHVALATVKNHMVRILAKTQTSSRREAVEQVLGVTLSDAKCDHCQIGAKARVMAAEMRRMADDLDK